MYAWIFHLLVIVMITSSFHATNGDSESKLITYLLRDYHPGEPPTNEGAVEVELPLATMYFDFIVWNDYRLKWNESEYGGTKMVVLDRKSIWLPDIEATNSIRFNEAIGSTLDVRSSGLVKWMQYFQIEFLCHMNLKYFPYDSQTCEIEFALWHYTTEHVNFTAGYWWTYPTWYGLKRVKSAKDFNVTSLGVQGTEYGYEYLDPYSSVYVTYIISLKRISSAYSAKIIIPSVLTGFLVLATFLLPTASYEKITLCSILFLCLLVLIAFVHTLIPSTGETVIGQFLVFALFVDFFATIMAVVSYNMKTIGHSTPTGNGINMELEDRTGECEEEGTHVSKIPLSRKLVWLRYLDLISFAIFTFVFIVGLAVILGQRE